MRRLNHTAEYSRLADLLRLQPGQVVVDVRARADEMPGQLVQRTGQRGLVVCCSFADRHLKALHKLTGVRAVMAHPGQLPLPDGRVHAALLRSTDMLLSVEHAVREMERVTLPGAKVLVTYTEWCVELPDASERERELLDLLSVGPAADGLHFLAGMERQQRGFTGWQFDAYLLASSRPHESARFGYCWRSLLRAHLGRHQQLTAPEILSLIRRLEKHPKAQVSASRYLALGTRQR